MIKTLTKYIVNWYCVYKARLDLTALFTGISVDIYIHSSLIYILPTSSWKEIVRRKKLHQ